MMMEMAEQVVGYKDEDVVEQGVEVAQMAVVGVAAEVAKMVKAAAVAVVV